MAPTKDEDGRAALDDMASFEGPVDDLHNAIAASQRLLASVATKDEEE